MSGNLNTNKIAAAILCAGLIGMVTGKVTEFLYDGGPKHPGHHEEARGYTIEVVEAPAGGGAVAATAGELTEFYATADVKAGEEYFNKKCATCHTHDKGGADKVGPHLWGVVNRKVASASGFNYSSGMKEHGDRKWDFNELNHFLWGPGKWVKGTMMAFAGITKDQDRANVITFLATQSDSPSKPK